MGVVELNQSQRLSLVFDLPLPSICTLALGATITENEKMTVTQGELDSFHRFASERLTGEGDLTIDDLVIEWDSTRNRDEINAAIREGLSDIDAGRTRSAKEVTEELRKKYIAE